MSGTCDTQNDEHEGLHPTGETGRDEEGAYEILACQCGAKRLKRNI